MRGVPTDADRDPTAIAERGAGRRAALLPTKNSLENQSQAISQRGRNTRTGLGFDRVWSCCIDARVWQGSAKHVTHSLSIRTCAGEPRSVTRIRAGRLLGAHATAARSGISNRLHRPFLLPPCDLPQTPAHPPATPGEVRLDLASAARPNSRRGALIRHAACGRRGAEKRTAMRSRNPDRYMGPSGPSPTVKDRSSDRLQ